MFTPEGLLYNPSGSSPCLIQHIFYNFKKLGLFEQDLSSVVSQRMDSDGRLGGDKTMDLTNGGLKSYSRFGDQWKQMADAEKKATLNAEMDRMKVLPGNSTYAAHRIRVLNKVLELVSKQMRTRSENEELELLFSGLSL